MNYADKLRELADFLEDRPNLMAHFDEYYDNPHEYIYATDWENFQALTRELGTYDKDGYKGTLSARARKRDLDGAHIFTINVSVSDVCEMVPKVDEDGQPVMKKVTKTVTEYVETGEEEPEMEWKCPQVWSS